MILLDTHVWIWLNSASHLIPPELATAIGEQPLAISSITIWETMMLIEKGRIRSSISPERTVRTWLDGNPIDVIEVTGDIAILARTLPFTHEDPADRFIAATACSLNFPLATIDGNLLGLTWLKHAYRG